MVRELSVRQVTSASLSELRRAMAGLEAPPVPSVTLTWRGRARARALDGALVVEIAPDTGGRSCVTCRYRFAGPFAWLLGQDAYALLKGNLQYIAAVICHRAERLRVSSDGRPPPAREVVGSTGVAGDRHEGADARRAPVARLVPSSGDGGDPCADRTAHRPDEPGGRGGRSEVAAAG